MPFADVLHQASALRRIQRAVQSGHMPHAYLFTGPAGVGKEMLASRLAALLLCEAPQRKAPPAACAGLPAWLDACGQCEDCVMLAVGTHPDYHRIHRMLKDLHPDKRIRDRKAIELSIDVIRHFLLGQIGLSPARGRARVFVIVEAERLSDQAQNAMLKTLEEPPGRATLILLTTSADAMLPTTRSRCQIVAFSPLPAAFVAEQLVEQAGLPAADARFLAEMAQGSLAASMKLSQLGVHARLAEVRRLLIAAGDDPLGSGKELLELSKSFAEALGESDDDGEADTNAAREGHSIVLAMVSTLLRDVQRIIAGVPPAASADRSALADLAATTNTAAVRAAIRAAADAEYQISRNANAALVFDAFGLALSRLSRPPRAASA